MAVTLQYSYAKINVQTGECTTCITCSYEINAEGWIEVPISSDDYIGKYYNATTDLWYENAEMTVEATEINAMYHG